MGLQENQNRSSFGILADVKLGHELPAESRGRIALDSDVEGSFPVDITSEVVVQSFLLIARRDQLRITHLSDCYQVSCTRTYS